MYSTLYDRGQNDTQSFTDLEGSHDSVQSMGIHSEMNIHDLPSGIYSDIVQHIDASCKFQDVAAVTDCDSVFSVKISQIHQCQNGHQPPTERLFKIWAERGMTVGKLAEILDILRLEAPLKNIKDPEPLRIVKQPPQLLKLEEGDLLGLDCEAVGFPYPRYTWFHSDKMLTVNFDGHLEITNVSVSNGGHYICRVHNDTGACFFTTYCEVVITKKPGSAKGTFHVSGFGNDCSGEMLIVKQPTCQKNHIGGIVIFKVDAVGPGQLSYEWYHNSVVVPGACTNELRLSIESHEQEGKYQCRVSSSAISETRLSREANLELEDARTGSYFAHDKVALVIGQCNYRSNWDPLPAVKNDVRVAKEVFEKLDFKVLSFLDLTLEEMLKAVDLFCDLLDGANGPDGIYAVLYVAGHGLWVEGQHYLMPWDHREGPQTSSCLCVEDVEARISKKNPAFLFIIADLCRLRYLVNMDVPTTGPRMREEHTSYNSCQRMVFYASSLGEKAYEDKDRGIFSKYLLSVIEKKITLYDIYKEFTIGFSKFKFPVDKCQKPEITFNIQQLGRRLTDARQPREHMLCDLQDALHRREEKWSKCIMRPQDIQWRSLGSGLQIRISYKVLYTNALEIHLDFRGRWDAAALSDYRFRASIPSNDIPDDMNTQTFYGGHDKIVLTIFDLQRLRKSLAVNVNVTFFICGDHTLTIPQNLGFPLAATMWAVFRRQETHIRLRMDKLTLDEDHHNGDSLRKQPMEQEDEKSLSL